MLTAMLTHVGSVVSMIPFTAPTWFVIAILAGFVWLFAKGSRDPNNPILWEHLIIDSSNNRASPYKLGFLIGLIISTWIVLTFADKDKLTYDIFGMYLTYLLGGAGWNSISKNKNASSETETSGSADQK